MAAQVDFDDHSGRSCLWELTPFHLRNWRLSRIKFWKKAICGFGHFFASFEEDFVFFVFLFFCLSVFFVFLVFCLFAFLSFCLFVFLSFCLFIFLSFCLFVFLSIFVSKFLSGSDSLTDWLTKVRYRAARAAKRYVFFGSPGCRAHCKCAGFLWLNTHLFVHVSGWAETLSTFVATIYL